MSFRVVTSATIGGKRWRIGFGYPGSTKGVTDDGSTDDELRKIVVQTQRKGRSRSIEEVVCHELLHAANPALSEQFCTEFGELFDRVLKKLKEADET